MYGISSRQEWGSGYGVQLSATTLFSDIRPLLARDVVMSRAHILSFDGRIYVLIDRK
jgi:hypothetical protein